MTKGRCEQDIRIKEYNWRRENNSNKEEKGTLTLQLPGGNEDIYQGLASNVLLLSSTYLFLSEPFFQM